MKKINNGFNWFILALGIAQLSSFCPAYCYGESTGTVKQSRFQGKRLSKAQINTSLEKTHHLLSGPDTAGSRMRSKALAETLALEGNEALPLLSGFLNSDEIKKRKFAYGVLINIDTDESMKIIHDKFFSLYTDKAAADKITVVGAAGSYQSETISSDVQAVRNYWEARAILRAALNADSKRAIPMCLRVYKDLNGIGVIASKYLWRKSGKDFMPAFVSHSQSLVETERFYTFVKEFGAIFAKDDPGLYVEMLQAKNDFKQKAIGIVLDSKSSENILWEVIEYLSNSEQDWFADNWVGLFKVHPKAAYLGSDVNVAILRGVSNNKASRKHVGELKGILNEHDYEFFEDSIKRADLARQEKAKWESGTK